MYRVWSENSFEKFYVFSELGSIGPLGSAQYFNHVLCMLATMKG